MQRGWPSTEIRALSANLHWPRFAEEIKNGLQQSAVGLMPNDIDTILHNDETIARLPQTVRKAINNAHQDRSKNP